MTIAPLFFILIVEKIIIFFSSLLCGHLLPLLIHRKDISYSSAGASGAIFGCMCSYLLFHPYDSLLSIPLLGAIPNIYTVIGYMAVLLILSKKFNHGSIDYSIHLGGGAGGLLPAMIMYPELLPGIIAWWVKGAVIRPLNFTTRKDS